MITLEQLRANGLNPRASTGPKTALRNARSNNAWRHGLTIPIWRDAKLAADGEALAHEIAGADANSGLLELARRVAEAHVDVMRVRDLRREVLSAGLTDEEYNLRNATKRLPSRSLIELCLGRASPKKLALVLSDSSKELEILERYESRTLSRRHYAICAFRAARSHDPNRPKLIDFSGGPQAV